VQLKVCLSHAPTRLQMPAWLGLESEVGGWAVMDSGGMARVLAEMEHPQNQYLLIHLFVGRTAKAQALRSLYPYNNTGRQGGLGFARLHYAPVTHPHTVIFIDGSLSRPTAKSCPRAPLRRYHIQNSTGRSYQEIQGLLYRCLLLPRADTWTLFADDIGGLCQVENLLAAWCAALSSDALEPTSIARPRLIVVLTDLRDTVGPLETLESTLRAWSPLSACWTCETERSYPWWVVLSRCGDCSHRNWMRRTSHGARPTSSSLPFISTGSGESPYVTSHDSLRPRSTAFEHATLIDPRKTRPRDICGSSWIPLTGPARPPTL
jgi:hypothetical protein